MGTASIVQPSGLPRSWPARVAVSLVILWSAINVVASGYFASTHTVEVTHRTVAAGVGAAIVASATTVAYVIVVQRAPSTLRWGVTVVIAVLLFAAPTYAVKIPQAQHAFTASDVLGAAAAGLTICAPLVRFYRRKP